MHDEHQQVWRAYTGGTAWPTLALAVVSLTAWVTVVAAHAAGQLSHGLALAANTLLVYVAFTPLHEATHGNVGGTQARAWLDHLVGWPMAAMMLSPYPAFRSLHLRHHARTNDPEADPDMWVRGSWPVALLRSFAILPHYDHFFLTRLVHTSTSAMAQRSLMIASLGMMLVSLTILTLAGFGATVLFALVAPAILGTGLLAFFFDWLPHHPHDTQGRFVDTRVVEARWLTLPLLWQNLHLVHHLWPRVPFYRYGAVYQRVLPLLVAKGSPLPRHHA